MNIYIYIYLYMYAQTRNIPLLLLTDVSLYAKICEKVRQKKYIKNLYLAVNPNNDTPTTKPPELSMLPSGNPYGS